MASEKVLAFVENVKELTVLELAELVKALEEEFAFPPLLRLLLLLLRLLPLLLRRKTEFDVILRALALPRWALSNWLKRSPAWA